MPIIGTLPFTFSPGTLIVSGQVDADLQFIVDQVNANAQPGGSAGFTNLVTSGQFTALVNATATAVPFVSAINDVNSEIVGGVFQPVNAGIYLFSGPFFMQSDAATTGISGQTQQPAFYVNTAFNANLLGISWPFANSTPAVAPLPVCGALTLAASDQVQIRITASFTATAPHGGSTGISIQRIA